MAEFCLDCLNKFIGDEKERLAEDDVVMDWDFCEECEKWKMCVIKKKRKLNLLRFMKLRHTPM